MNSTVLLINMLLSIITTNYGLTFTQIDSILQPTTIIAYKYNEDGTIAKEYNSVFSYAGGVPKLYQLPTTNLISRFTYSNNHLSSEFVKRRNSMLDLEENYSYEYNDEKLSIINHQRCEIWEGCSPDIYTDQTTYMYYDDGRLHHVDKDYFPVRLIEDTLSIYNQTNTLRNYRVSWDYTYNDAERTKTEIYIPEYGAYSQAVYRYNLDYTLLSVETSVFGEDTVTTLLTFSYTTTGNVDFEITQTKEQTGWINSSCTFYVYDDQNRVVEQQFGQWNTECKEWNVYKRCIFDYSNDGLTLVFSVWKNEGGEWVRDYFRNQMVFYDLRLGLQQRTLRWLGGGEDGWFCYAHELVIFLEPTIVPPYTDTQESVNQKFSAYPNPAKNQLTITSPVEQTRVMVYDLTGRLVEARHFDFKTDINTEDWTPGIYVYEIWKDARRLHSGKIVKE